MRLALGSPSRSASGGTMTLIGRRGEPIEPVASEPQALRDAVASLPSYPDVVPAGTVASDDPERPRFTPGELILWRYSRLIETAWVVQDDDRGLVAWTPCGAARLRPVRSDGQTAREVPLHERFDGAREMAETTWGGRGILRVAPAGKPWSVWFFRNAEGAFTGAYVNLELPHRRVGATADEVGAVHSRDLVLDVWMDAAHPGAEDVWLKDADELATVVKRGRFTQRHASAIRVLADAAIDECVAPLAWPLGAGWETWMPDDVLNVPTALPDTPAVRAARRLRDPADLG